MVSAAVQQQVPDYSDYYPDYPDICISTDRYIFDVLIRAHTAIIMPSYACFSVLVPEPRPSTSGISLSAGSKMASRKRRRGLSDNGEVMGKTLEKANVPTLTCTRPMTSKLRLSVVYMTVILVLMNEMMKVLVVCCVCPGSTKISSVALIREADRGRAPSRKRHRSSTEEPSEPQSHIPAKRKFKTNRTPAEEA